MTKAERWGKERYKKRCKKDTKKKKEKMSLGAQNRPPAVHLCVGLMLPGDIRPKMERLPRSDNSIVGFVLRVCFGLVNTIFFLTGVVLMLRTTCNEVGTSPLKGDSLLAEEEVVVVV